MHTLNIILAVWFCLTQVIGVLAAFYMIGKKREPLNSSTALGVLISAMGIIYLLAKAYL